MDPETILTRKLEYWIRANTPVQPSPPTPAGETVLSRVEVDLSWTDKDLLARMSKMSVFSGSTWKDTYSLVAFLVTRLDADSSIRVEEILSSIQSPPPVSTRLAEKWFSSVTTLYPEAYETAIMGFFKIVWMWEQLGSVMGSSLEVMLSYYFRALQALGEKPAYAPSIHVLFNLAKGWPERLCYWLDRASSGGVDVILAMKRAQLLLPEASSKARETLLDFATEMGWRLLDEEDLPLWRMIGRRGEALYQRLRGYTIPTTSLRLLAGMLGILEKKGGIEAHISELRIKTASKVFRETDMEIISRVLENMPEACDCLDAIAETELTVEIVSLKGLLTDPIMTSREIAEFTAISSGGLRVSNIMRFLKNLNGTINEEQIHTAVSLARKLDIDRKKDLSDCFLKAFILIDRVMVGKEIEHATKNSINKVFGAILSCGDPDMAVQKLEQTLNSPDTDSGKILDTASLLLRASPDVGPAEILEQTQAADRLLSLIGKSGRERVFSGLPPFWFKTLSSYGMVAFEQVSFSIMEIQEKNKRSRFLDKVVSAILEDLSPLDVVFEECIAAAVIEYNKADTTQALRDAERAALQRLFRAGTRTLALDNAMAGLLRIPGLEGGRATILLQTLRKICEAFTRQEVWQDKNNAAVSMFFDHGLNSIIRAFVDYPEAIDLMTGTKVDDLIDRLMPSGSDTDGQVARWQTETGATFFGRILPLAVELFGKEPERLHQFLRSVGIEAMRLDQGVPAGETFLSKAALSLEHRVIEEYTIRLESWLNDKTTPPLRFSEDWARVFHENINENTKARAGIQSEAARTAQLLTMRKDLRTNFVDLSSELFTSLLKAGLYEEEKMIRKGWKAGVSSFSSAMGSVDLLDVFRTFEKDRDKLSIEQMESAEKFFLLEGDPRGENPCHFWRRRVYSQFCNCIIDMLLLDNSKPSNIFPLLQGFREVIEFLGAESCSAILAAFGMSLSGSAVRTTDDARKNMERQLFRPLWKRRSMTRLELLVSGMSNQNMLLDRLTDRLSKEGNITGQVSFLRWFGLMFLVVEEAVQKTSSEKSTSRYIRDALQESWVFNPEIPREGPFIDTVREAAEIAEEVFRLVRQKKGIITSEEADEISVQMRRKYRDNAESVAILLKWTLEPSREPLLRILEENASLLQAVSSDTELMKMLDVYGERPNFAELAEPLAGNPAKLKKKLMEMDAGK